MNEIEISKQVTEVLKFLNVGKINEKIRKKKVNKRKIK